MEREARRELLAQAAEARRDKKDQDLSSSLDQVTYQSILRQNRNKALESHEEKAQSDDAPQATSMNNNETHSKYTGEQASKQIELPPPTPTNAQKSMTRLSKLTEMGQQLQRQEEQASASSLYTLDNRSTDTLVDPVDTTPSPESLNITQKQGAATPSLYTLDNTLVDSADTAPSNTLLHGEKRTSSNETQPPEALHREEDRISDSAQNLPSEQQQQIHQDLPSEQQQQIQHTTSQEFRSEQARSMYHIEGFRITDNTQNMPIEEQQQIHQKWLNTIPQEFRSEQAQTIYLIEGFRITESTQNMPIEEQQQIHQKWLNTIPQEFRSEQAQMLYLIENFRREDQNAEKHRNLVYNIIQEKQLNIQIPNQRSQEWRNFAANLISEYEDGIDPKTGEERGLGSSLILGDFLQGGTHIEPSWNKIRDSDEYIALGTWALTKWEEWPGRKQQAQQDTNRQAQQDTNRQAQQDTNWPIGQPTLRITVYEQAPDKKNLPAAEIPKQETQQSTPKQLQETQQSTREEQNEDGLVPSEQFHIPEDDTDDNSIIHDDYSIIHGDDSIIIKKKKKQKLEFISEIFQKSQEDNKKKIQKAQELEHIQQEQEYKKEEENSRNKAIEEYNKLCIEDDYQAKIANLFEKRTREIQVLYEKYRRIPHDGSEGEILGY
jgi:predicted Zn-dependent protease with MMP-like domain